MFDNYFAIALVIFAATLIIVLCVVAQTLKTTSKIMSFDMGLKGERLGFTIIVLCVITALSSLWPVSIPVAIASVVSYSVITKLSNKA
jgi:flagellar biosynthesis protein FlhB